MSVKTKLARQAVRTTARHTASGATAKITRRPLRSATLLTIGALAGGLIGWLIGRSGGAEVPEPIAAAPAPPSVADIDDDSTGRPSQTGVVS